MIADAEVRVRLDVVAPERARAAPTHRGSAASARTRRRRHRAVRPRARRAQPRSASERVGRVRARAPSRADPTGESDTSVIAAWIVRSRGHRYRWRDAETESADPRPRTPKAADAARAGAARGHRAHRSTAVGSHARDRSVRQGRRSGRRGRASGSAKLPVAAVYASPIERTTQTAQQIAAHHGLEVLPLPGVIEADYGEWTGGKIADLAKTDEWKVVQVAPSRARFPDGETIREMQARTVAALDEVDRAPSARDRRRREPRRSDQVGDRALHAACISTCSSVCTCRPRR